MGVHSDEYYGWSWENDFRQRGRWSQERVPDRLAKLSPEQFTDLFNGNHSNAPEEVIETARILSGCGWLG